MIRICIPTYNAGLVCARAIESIFRVTTESVFEILVMDNSNIDSHREALVNDLRSYNLRDKVKILYSRTNLMFTASQNRLLMLPGDWDIAVLMNDDMEIPVGSGDWLTRLCSFLSDNSRVASVSPVSLLPGGGIYYAGIEDRRRHRLAGQKWTINTMTGPFKTPWNNMACTAIRREVWNRVGPLDETLAHYGSDEEWGTRAVRMGYEHWVLPVVITHHHITGKRPDYPARETLFGGVNDHIYRRTV